MLPGLVVLGQALSSLVGVISDLSGGPFKDLLELWLQSLHDGVNGLGDLPEFSQSFDQDPHELGAVLLRVRVQIVLQISNCTHTHTQHKRFIIDLLTRRCVLSFIAVFCL